MDTTLLHELPLATAERWPQRLALTSGAESLTYAEFVRDIRAFSAGLLECGLARAERVGIYLDKRFETAIAAIGATAAGGAMVPINPLLKPDQVRYILQDCNVRVLVTSAQRFANVRESLLACRELAQVIIVDAAGELPRLQHCSVSRWSDICRANARRGHRIIDGDMAAILYTSGSTGKPKGVVLSHRNMVAGAKSVASYLENNEHDTLLAALPLSFDAGFSQLTTAFHAGARVVLLNYLLPNELISTIARERVTGLTGVPPLYVQLSEVEWPASITEHLRYFANTGGRMPLATLSRLRRMLPMTKPFLMYGLTEAFRATYLPPEEVDRRPDSIGKAIPNVEVLVLRPDGSRCTVNEPGELVQRGTLVAMGYWNDPERTAERFRPLPPCAEAQALLPEIAVYSGDTVRADEDGFLYFIGRRDEMIKTSGYRVSPTEIEEVLYAQDCVGEAAAFGIEHPTLGQAIVVVAVPKAGAEISAEALLGACRQRLPLYMIPARMSVRAGPLPRNPNGKIDRKALAAEFAEVFGEAAK